MRSNDPTKPLYTGQAVNSVPNKLCIIKEDGSRMRFPYHALMAEDLQMGEDPRIILKFMADIVTLRGINLIALFDYLGQEPPYLYVMPSRYHPLIHGQPFILTEAIIDETPAANGEK